MMDDLTFNIALKKLCGAQLGSMGPQRINLCLPIVNEVMVKYIFILFLSGHNGVINNMFFYSLFIWHKGDMEDLLP